MSLNRVILDDPVVSLSLLHEDSNPVVLSVLVHEEWMDAIGLLSWKLAILLACELIHSPHGVDAILEEETICHRSLTKTHHSPEVISLLCDSMETDPVEVRIVNEIAELQECWLLGTNILSEVHLEGIALNGNVLAKFGAERKAATGVSNLIRYLKVSSLSNYSRIIGPCPLDIDKFSVKHANSDLKIRKDILGML